MPQCKTTLPAPLHRALLKLADDRGLNISAIMREYIVKGYRADHGEPDPEKAKAAVSGYDLV